MYYFMFSSGEYSDYGVGGVFSCDHAVTEKEWDAFCKVYQDECQRLHKIASDKYGRDWYVLWKSEEYKAYEEYLGRDVEGEFQKLHGMVELEVAEFWRDC